jgi:hypothetical protein
MNFVIDKNINTAQDITHTFDRTTLFASFVVVAFLRRRE